MKSVHVLALSLIVGGISLSALAQNERPGQPGNRPAGQPDRQPREGGPPPREGGPRMGMPALPAEKAKAAWSAQAKGVAAGLTLDAEKAGSLVKAYVEARQANTEATDKIRKEIAERREKDEEARAGIADLQKQLLEVARSSRENFEKAIAGFLAAEQVTKAMASLGTFNRQWDIMTDTVLGFSLDATKGGEAAKAMQTYVEAMGAGRPRDGGTPGEGAPANIGNARRDLMDTMKGILTEAQFKTFEESLGMGGRRGGGGGGQDGEPRRRPGGGGG
ncbi:MAG: hypothetical protein HBSAPP03_17890 [Phycisphaerae bacterium]|nr:MAG: hypothetical protein HBSAPP03_17890 [Phycisphaerae bacterium]